MIIGILALQGDFIEHIHMLEKLGVKTAEIRKPGELDQVQGLIIPGGESTTMMKLMHSFGLIDPIKQFAAGKLPVWGTCAGLICIASNVHNPDSTPMETLGLMNITVTRNAFGRQVDSFETTLQIAELQDGPFPGVFIRAPYIEKAGKGVEVLAALPDGRIVAARQGNLLATSFHPELTSDSRLHRYFSELIPV
ncbi:MAG: pyridoxal 5'-phosphate synthase glutaminase subunit PdxT [Chloroflexi bacterium]|nr:pyridoxal 5'-phosphate synthase glutaminase subunit PdxT [Chloroflexota bacterium]